MESVNTSVSSKRAKSERDEANGKHHMGSQKGKVEQKKNEKKKEGLKNKENVLGIPGCESTLGQEEKLFQEARENL